MDGWIVVWPVRKNVVSYQEAKSALTVFKKLYSIQF